VPRIVACAMMLASLTLAALAPSRAHALVSETVTIDSGRASKGQFTAQLVRPSGAGPFAAVVAMHGCAGLLNDKGKLRARETDWAERFAARGYAVLFPDSFTARGVREICTSTTRSIFPRDRADDIAAAAEWLASQPFIDKSRLALMGWSHGAMAVLWAVRPGFLDAPPRFKAAIAFYPGCRQIARLEDWRPSLPLTLLIGGADDWTRPGPCRELARRTGFRFIEYVGAYHGFDAPASRVRVRRGLGAVEGGHAHVGTDPAARDAAIKEVMDTLRMALGGP
jgi:dienelactone hydrolase